MIEGITKPSDQGCLIPSDYHQEESACMSFRAVLRLKAVAARNATVGIACP